MLSIDRNLKRHCPALQIVCVQGTVAVSKSADALVQLLNARAAQLSNQIASPEIVSNPDVAATRDAYRSLGKDPSRYRGSAEALLRRVTSGKALYFINNLVDINNLVSLESFFPVGSYDFTRLTGEIVFRIGKSGESYKGIGKDLINIADLPIFADNEGPFGSPTSDSERSMITSSTRQFAMMIISFAGKADLNVPAERAIELLTNHAHGSGLSFQIIS